MSDQIVTRFAPSPTGYLHIGGARTALFNWLFARGHGGKMLLRIEDTDRARSTEGATEAILKGLEWLGIDYDGEVVSQYQRIPRHAEVAREMLARGSAYQCYSTPEEINDFREKAKADGTSQLFRSPWRDADPSTYPDRPYVIRLKAPREGVTVVRDKVQGDVTVRNDQLDDMICLRSDGVPTYMLAVVVDDFDMGVTHVIRGDDHLVNAARQMQIYHGMGWDVPVYAHIPLIHGPDGKKLSKRHGAVGLHEYQAMGYPASGMRNYLTRLGWSHGDDEFFTDAQAKEWFELENINRAPSRLDFKKLENLCGKHMAILDDADVMAGLDGYLEAAELPPIPAEKRTLLVNAMPFLKTSAKTYPQLVEKAEFALASRPIVPDEKSEKNLDSVSRGILAELTQQLQNASWTQEELEGILSKVAEAHGVKFGALAAPIRAALAGRSVTPSLYDMMLVLGRDETLARMTDQAA